MLWGCRNRGQANQAGRGVDRIFHFHASLAEQQRQLVNIGE